MAELDPKDPNVINAGKFLYDAEASSDVAVGSTVFLTTGAVGVLKATGNLVQITRDELEPAAAGNPALKDASGKDLPIYVVPGVGQFKDNAKVVTLENGQQIALVDEGLHKWNEKYVADNMMPTDAAIAKNPDLISPEEYLKRLEKQTNDPQKFAEMRKRFETIIGEAGNETGNRHIEPPPKVMINVGLQTGTTALASSVTSKEKNNYVILGSGVLEKFALKTDELANGYRGVVGHELTHIERGDTTVAGLLRGKEDPAVSRFMESEADFVGSGPRGSGNPEATANFFKAYLADKYHDYAEVKHIKPDAKPTDKDLQNVSDWLKEQDPVHPTLWNRVVALEYEDKLLRQEPSAVAKANPQKESDDIAARVMQFMNGKRELPETDPMVAKSPPDANPPRPHSEIPDKNKWAAGDGVQLAALTQSPDVLAIQATMQKAGAQPLDLQRAPDGVQRASGLVVRT